MKRLFTFLAIIFFFCVQMQAQSWSAARLGISVGGDIEVPYLLDHKYLLSTASGVDFDASELPFSEGELVSMACDNSTLRLSLSFIPAGKQKTEFQFSLLSIDARIDKVRYEMDEGQFAEVSAVNKEIALEGVYLFREQVSKTFSFHGGIGTNMGYSHSGEVSVKGYFLSEAITDNPSSAEDIDLTFRQKDSFNQRIFLQGGMGIRFLKRMEFGLNFRRGIGYRASFGGPVKFTTLKRSISFSLNYAL